MLKTLPFKLLLITALSINIQAFSQTKDTGKTTPAAQPPAEAEEGSLKNVRFGLRVSPASNWYNVINKNADNVSSVVKFGAGLLIEFNLTKTVSFQTGLGVDMAGGKISYNNSYNTSAGSTSVRYFYNKSEQEMDEYTEDPDRGNANLQEYILKERTFSQTYLSIPLNLRMKTSYFGKNRFFGQLGLDLQFKWNAFANDVVREVKQNGPTDEIGSSDMEVSKLIVKKDIFFINMPLNLGIGMERKLAGTTALVVSFNYYLGFMNAFDNNSDYLSLVTINDAGKKNTYGTFKQDIRTKRLALNIALLF